MTRRPVELQICFLLYTCCPLPLIPRRFLSSSVFVYILPLLEVRWDFIVGSLASSDFLRTVDLCMHSGQLYQVRLFLRLLSTELAQEDRCPAPPQHHPTPDPHPQLSQIK